MSDENGKLMQANLVLSPYIQANFPYLLYVDI
jgi:hypothetical protein